MISGILTNLKWILLLVTFLVVFYFLMKYEVTRAVGVILLVFVISLTGCLSIKQIAGYYTASGKTYGDTASLFNSNSARYTRQNNTFSFTKLGFKATSISNQYRSQIQDSNKINIDLSNDLALFVNDSLLANIKTTGNTISGEYAVKFSDSNGTEMLTDTLIVSIAIEKNMTEVVITTNGGDIAVGIWNTFTRKNGFDLEIQKTNLKDSQMEFIKMTIPETDGKYILQTSYYLNGESHNNGIYFDQYNGTLSLEADGKYYQNLSYTRNQDTIIFYKPNNTLCKVFLISDNVLSLTVSDDTQYFVSDTVITDIAFEISAISVYKNSESTISFANNLVEIYVPNATDTYAVYTQYNNALVFTDSNNNTKTIILLSNYSLEYDGEVYSIM